MRIYDSNGNLQYSDILGELNLGKYIRNITIDNSSNANNLTDYQVLITLDTATLISAGKMRSDCGDIRFYDGANNLSYWIESGINTSSTRIWVKVPSIPASSSKVISMYYGNPNLGSISNGDNTFSFFDDFNGTSLDTDKWLTIGSPSISFSNSQLTFYSTSDYSALYTKTSYATNTAMRWYGIFGNSSKGYYAQGYWLNTVKSWDFSSGYTSPAFIVHWETAPKIEAYPSKTDTGYTTTNRPLRIYEVRRKSNGNAVFLINDSQVYSDTSLTDTSPYSFGTQHYSADGSANAHVFDYVFVRKYIYPDPSTSVGSEYAASSIRIR